MSSDSIKMIANNLRGAVANEAEGRRMMAMAQYIAGMGFSNVGLGIDHAMAHTLSAHYDTPHGVACAMFLPISMEFNRDYTGEKYREIARVFGVEGVDEMSQEEYRDAAIAAVKQLSIDVGIPTKNEKIRKAVMKFCQARLSPPLIGQIVAEASLDAPEEYYRDVYDEYVERRKCLIDGLNRIPGVYSLTRFQL